LPKCREAGLYLRVVLGIAYEHPDATGWLLRSRRLWPRNGRTAKHSDEIAPPQSEKFVRRKSMKNSEEKS
jgi:hypothetical protein